MGEVLASKAHASPGVSSGVVARLALVQGLAQTQLAVLERPAHNRKTLVSMHALNALLERLRYKAEVVSQVECRIES